MDLINYNNYFGHAKQPTAKSHPDDTRTSSRPQHAENFIREDGPPASGTARTLPVELASLAAHVNCKSQQLLRQVSESVDALRRLRLSWVQDASTSDKALARQAALLEELQSATTYREKRRIHKELYALRTDASLDAERRQRLFDAALVQRRTQALEDARNLGDLPGMLGLLRTQLTRNLGWMCSPELFHEPGVRTESTIDRYQKAVRDAINAIVEACKRNDPRLDKSFAQSELKQTIKAFGRTALLCSGGGTMGMAHIGVIKSLYDMGRLPKVISGSSAGAIVCAVLCTRTHDELPRMLDDFCHGDLAVFVGEHEPPGWPARIRHYRKYGYLFDSQNLERVMKKHLGDMTFEEAQSRTGRILNITISNLRGTYQAHRVLNYINAGDVVIWSAVVASCALPWGFKPGKLFTKRRGTQELVEVKENEYVDGSIGGDIPLLKMSQQFQCNYYIVAQANPHVLTCYQLREAFGSGALGQILEPWFSAAVDELMDLVSSCGRTGEILAGLVEQPYSGDVTIAPQLTLGGLMKVLSNPTPEFMDAARAAGEANTFPFLPMIRNHIKIERALGKGYRDIKEARHFSDSQSDLRRLQLERNARPRHRRRNSSKDGRKLSITITDKPQGRKAQQLPQPQRPGVLPPAKDAGTALRSRTRDSSLERKTKFELSSDKDSDANDDDDDTDSITSVTPPPEEHDDKSDGDSDLEALIVKSFSAPSSPRPTTKVIFGSPTRTRSRSPVPPVSLMMTPKNGRPVSPVTCRAATGRCDSAAPLTATAVMDKAASQKSSPVTRQLPKTPANHAFRLGPPRPLRHKRSSSTGHLGVPQ